MIAARVAGRLPGFRSTAHRVALACGLALAPAVDAAPGAAPASATKVARPSAAELRAAFDRHDPVELERLSRRLGAVRLVALVEHGSPPSQQAALVGLELLGGADDDSGGLGFLPRLVALADRADTPPALALAVMESVSRIAGLVPRGELDTSELPPDLCRAAVDALTAFALKEDRAVPARISAVSAIGSLASLVPGAPTKLGSLGTVRDAMVRTAVASSLPPTAALLVKLIAEDGNNAVALAAGTQLCRDIPAPGAEKKSERSLQRALDLPAAAHARLRGLVADASLDEGDRLDVIPCLRAGAQRSPEDQKADLEALRALAQGPDGALKRKARAYGAR